jgi:feruloyl esterase
MVLGATVMKFMVAEDPNWNLDHFQFDRDIPLVKAKLGPTVDVAGADLSKFAARGGKLIMYHGWSDPSVPPAASVAYYERTIRNIGPAKARGSVRLFMVPGMMHCLGGNGPTSFGALSAAVQPADPERNLSAALEAWVEAGRAPEQIIAVEPGDPARSGLLCAYPKLAEFKPGGDPKDANSYNCIGPPTSSAPRFRTVPRGDQGRPLNLKRGG